MLLTLLIGLPIVIGLSVFFVKSQQLTDDIVKLGSVAVVLLAVVFAALYWQGAEITVNSVWKTYVVTVADVAIALFIIISAIKMKKFLLCFLAVLQIGILLGYELSSSHAQSGVTFVVDRLALFMILIVGVVGGLICLFAVKYMRDYHKKHPEIQDRRGLFFSVLFVFTGAMFGLVLSNDIMLLLLFWEITTLASFLLIGYSQTKEAVSNAFMALVINVFGGLLFTIAIVISGSMLHVSDLRGVLSSVNGMAATAVVFLLACAALTKSAQMPFSKWLLGAMVAPTPVSAILHSATMVKAGVYLIIRLAPSLGLNAAGVTVTLVGGFTFIITAMMAISQSDAKKILAYSTISNLGLIVACAGINTPESIWAAMMLIIFHAVAKSLLFLTVGAAELCLGSRNVESMDGLYKISPKLTMFLIVGIAGMFIAPFGMLISKWAAMKAFVDYGNFVISSLILLIIAFGSTMTFFYWVKWMGKLIADTTLYTPEKTTYKMGAYEKISLYAHGAMVILLCMAFPVISNLFVIPYVSSVYMAAEVPIDGLDTVLALVIMFLFFIMAIISIPVYRRYRVSSSSVYMAGLNTGNDSTYHGSMGNTVTVHLSNWYLKSIFGEKIWFNKAVAISAILLLAGFGAALGGLSL